MDTNIALQKLKFSLLSAGYESDDADDIVRQASVEISSAVADAVADALNQAEMSGLDMGAVDFAAELRAVSAGDNFTITTDSGLSDFSEPPFPMLSHLLRGGKVAKDGSVYRRIPIPKNRQSSRATTSYQANEQRSAMLQAAKDKLNDEILGNHIPDPTMAAKSYASAYQSTRPTKIRDRVRKTASGPVGIVTASSKQNPATQWVLPQKDHDMTGILADINANLRQTIDAIVANVLAEYGV